MVLPTYFQYGGASVPSPEYSDSLDSTLTYSHSSTQVNNYNLNRELSSEACSREDSPCRIFTPNFKNKSTTNNVTAGCFSNELASRLKDSLSLTSCNFTTDINYADRKANEVRRVASSDSIPIKKVDSSVFNRSYCVLNPDNIKRARSPDARNQKQPQIRYIQSAKGTWTYNF